MTRKRIALKISGETLGGKQGKGFDIEFITKLVHNIISIENHDILITLGGGNIFRGNQKEQLSLSQASADHVGMLATIMNGIVLKEIFESFGRPVSLFSTLAIPQICDTYQRNEVSLALEKGNIVICTGGLGVPYFTTDTAAVVRAIEHDCSILMKATKVKGIYSCDPLTDPSATFYNKLTYNEAITKNLKVMDRSAFEMAQTHHLQIVVFSIFENEPFTSVLNKNCEFTLVSEEEV